MFKKITLIFVCVLLATTLISCSNQKSATTINAEAADKNKAEKFSLSIVESYFNRECKTFYEALTDPFYLIEDDIPIEKDDNTEKKLCESILKAFEGEHTYQEYLGSYNVRVLDRDEFMTEPIMFEETYVRDLVNFKPTNNDYLFVGSSLKENKEDFMWEDMLFFIVRKVDDTWKISAISG